MADQQIPNLTDEEVMKAYVEDPRNKELHIKMAHMLEQTFRGKWFTVKDINAKTAVKNSQEATQMIIGLHLFGLCTSRELKNTNQFKITLTSEERLKVLLKHKENHLKQISLLDLEIEKIELEGIVK